jgi:hypothetical protein
MVPANLFRAAVDQLPQWRNSKMSHVGWVNWRDGYQVQLQWKGYESFSCYLDFGRNKAARNTVIASLFERHAPAGQKPAVIDGHGWQALDHTFSTNEFLSVNEVAELATEMGFDFTVLYVQASISSRPIFETMGIPLVPGETGKEWTGSEFISYATPTNRCL